ncbi:hypothetical protein H5410_015481 [Solanum commersonii]|uniref:Uncharacterized protein n=1 Tax=Solanum commersonii TaxID=4109 RepID=A0A9J5ZTV9_SOLCO|nr:hypothetical protein H5410_015481 [Solanum commersonii]
MEVFSRASTILGKVIQEEYGEENKWTTKEVLTPWGSLWKSIKILWPLLKINTTIKVGNGNKISFWEDKWLALLV